MKLKVFFDGTPLIGKYVSGIGKVLQETLYALDTEQYARTYSLYIFLPFDEKGKIDSLQFKFIKIRYLPYPHKFLSLFSRMKFSPPIDIFLGKGVYVFENFRNWNLAYSKSITYIHDVAFKRHPEFIEDRNLIYLNRNVQTWIKRSDVIVTVSEASRADIKDSLGVDSIVIPNAARSDLFSPKTESEIRNVRERWQIPDNYYLFIGNIEPRKNIENTIDACRSAAQDGDALVLIGGGGWRNEAILSKASTSTKEGFPVIRPSGYVPDEDLPALISGAKVLIHFPWYEGSGLPILQAVSCGTPVASSSIAPLIEVASGFSDRVSFANPADIDAMAEAIKDASVKAHETHPDKYSSWELSAQKLIKVIDSI